MRQYVVSHTPKHAFLEHSKLVSSNEVIQEFVQTGWKRVTSSRRGRIRKIRPRRRVVVYAAHECKPSI